MEILTWIKIGIVVALVAALWVAKASYDHKLINQGKAEVQALWDAAVEARKVKDIANAKESNEFALRLDAKRTSDFTALAKRNAALTAQLDSIVINPATVAGLSNTVSTINGKSSGEPSPAAGPVSGTALDEWFQAVGEWATACIDKQSGWIAWDNRRVSN